MGREVRGVGLKRGDIKTNEAGLYIVRREIATDGQGVVESKSLQVLCTVDKGVEESQQDKLFEDINMWASSKSQQLDDTSTKNYKDRHQERVWELVCWWGQQQHHELLAERLRHVQRGCAQGEEPIE